MRPTIQQSITHLLQTPMSLLLELNVCACADCFTDVQDLRGKVELKQPLYLSIIVNRKIGLL